LDKVGKCNWFNGYPLANSEYRLMAETLWFAPFVFAVIGYENNFWIKLIFFICQKKINFSFICQ
jgi:hypothetical protein